MSNRIAQAHWKKWDNPNDLAREARRLVHRFAPLVAPGWEIANVRVKPIQTDPTAQAVSAIDTRERRVEIIISPSVKPFELNQVVLHELTHLLTVDYPRMARDIIEELASPQSVAVHFKLLHQEQEKMTDQIAIAILKAANMPYGTVVADSEPPDPLESS